MDGTLSERRNVKTKKEREKEVDPFVVMDNGVTFYLRVIGLTPLSLASKKRRVSHG